MHLALVTERVPASPWHAEHLAAALVAALAGRGHRMDLICESFDDDRLAVPPGVTVHPRRGCCLRSATRPWALRDFARARLQALGPEATLSLTRLLPAPVWMPIIPSASTAAGRALRLRGFEPMVREARALPLTATKGLLETFARGDHYGVRRLLAFGPRAAEAARTELPLYRDRVADVGFLPLTTRPDEARRADLRTRLRRAVQIDPDATVILLSAPLGMQRDLAGPLEAAAHLYRQAGRRAPVLIIASMDPYAVHDAALRVEAQQVVRLAGVTARPEALLCAADLVAAWCRGPLHAFAAGSASRLIAESLSFGLPVLADRRAPGAELIADVRERHAPGDTAPAAPGLLVDGPASLAWYIALQSAADPQWLAAARAHAAIRAADFAPDASGATPLDRLAARLEAELAAAAEARTAPGALPSPPIAPALDTPTA